MRSRTDTAMVNEALCKFVAHNLTCVILSRIELGIDATFWQNDNAPRDVLRMPANGGRNAIGHQ